MLNLIKMDFDVYRSSFLWIIIYSVLFSAIYSNTTFIGTISIICIYMLIFSAFAAEERDRIHLLHKALPLSDKEIVGVKYIESVIVWILDVAVGTVVIFISQYVKRVIGIDVELFDAKEFVTMLLVLFALSMLLVSVTVPLIYKFGYSKGRFIGMIIWFAIAFGFSFIFYSIDFSGLRVTNSLIYIADILISAVFMVISFLISVKIYKAD